MSKKNFKLLSFKRLILFFVLLAAFLTACNGNAQEGKNKNSAKRIQQEEKEISQTHGEKNPQTTKKASLVKGAVSGSSSSYVVDRELWKDFIEKKDENMAKDPMNGLHIPKILLDSDDAKRANKEIEEIISHLKDIYGQLKKDYASEEYEDICIHGSFSVYQDEKLMSVHLKYNENLYGFLPDHRAYNFSLPDGKFISDDKLLEHFGIKKEDILGLMQESITKEYSRIGEVEKAYEQGGSYINSIEYLEGLALKDLWDNYNSYKTRVFIDELGNPMFLYSQYTPAGAGVYTESLKLEGKSPNYTPYSPQYLKMAKELGIDVKNGKNKGIIIYLGSFWDENSLKQVLQKLYPWQALFNDYKDPGLLTVFDTDPQSPVKIKGQECYLLVPEYKNSIVSLVELEPSEDGKLKEVDNYMLETKFLTGPVLIYQNQSEIAPNAKIVMRYRDDITEFTPYISAMDGKVVLPKEIINGEKVLNFEKLAKEDMYSSVIFDMFSDLMGINHNEEKLY